MSNVRLKPQGVAMTPRVARPGGKRVGLVWACVSDAKRTWNHDRGCTYTGKEAPCPTCGSSPTMQTAEGQVVELLALAKQLNLDVPPRFVFRLDEEQAHSRWRGDPPQKAEVFKLARRRAFDVLLVWKLDRWSRRRRDGIYEVFYLLPQYGVTIVSAQEPFLSTESIPEGFRAALAEVIFWLAEEDSQSKSARVKLRYRTNRNRAAAGGGKAKWGSGRIPSPEDVARMRAMRGEGKSLREISKEMGIPKSTVSDTLRRPEEPKEEEPG